MNIDIEDPITQVNVENCSLMSGNSTLKLLTRPTSKKSEKVTTLSTIHALALSFSLVIVNCDCGIPYSSLLYKSFLRYLKKVKEETYVKVAINTCYGVSNANMTNPVNSSCKRKLGRANCSGSMFRRAAQHSSSSHGGSDVTGGGGGAE